MNRAISKIKAEYSRVLDLLSLEDRDIVLAHVEAVTEEARTEGPVNPRALFGLSVGIAVGMIGIISTFAWTMHAVDPPSCPECATCPEPIPCPATAEIQWRKDLYSDLEFATVNGAQCFSLRGVTTCIPDLPATPTTFPTTTAK